MEHEFFIFWVPRRTLVSNSILEEAGIIGDVNISEFPLYFMPLEQDVLSLELDSSFGDLYLVRSDAIRMEEHFVLIPRRIKIPGVFSNLQRPSWISNRDMGIFPE